MNKLTTLLTLTTAASLYTSAGQADINMMEASFKTSFIDLQIGTRGERFQLKRSYDSRSTYAGLFGFGWCSNLDVSLRATDTVTEVETCGAIEKVKATFEKGSYVRVTKNGVRQRFALDDGRLIGLREPGQVEVAIERRPGLEGLRDGQTNQLRIQIDDTGQRIKKIEGPEHQALFKYSSDGNLISVKNAWSNTYSHEYDRLHNLIRTSYPDSTEEKLTYDTDFDRLLSFTGRNGCKENYQHSFSNEAGKKTRTQTSVAQLNCPQKPGTEVRFDFEYIQRSDNRWALSQLRLTREGKTQVVDYKIGGFK